MNIKRMVDIIINQKRACMGLKLTKIVNNATFIDYGAGMTDKTILQEIYQLCGDSKEARFLIVDE
jgi:hypothetical protein